MRNKIITIRVNEELYNEFLKTVAKFTTVYTYDFPSRTKKRYYTRFPDKPFSPVDKYTLADLVDESMKEFIKKYKSDD